jgi:predicted dehydrogenase
MKLKVGLIGVGAIALESHLPALSDLKDVEIAAVCDQHIDAARKAASDFGIKRVYGDAEEMFSKERLDAVDICTPPRSHASLSIRAMEAGCHVLLEKPMASSIGEADRMVDCSRRYNVRLCVLHQNLCNPVVMKVKSMLESGVVGDLLNVEVATYERKDSGMVLDEHHWCHKLVGGIFYEIMPHPIYLIQSFLTNMEVIHVASAKLGDVKWMKKDEVRALVKSENGLGSILCSCNPPIHGDTLDILGSNMVLRADLWGRTLICLKPRKKSLLSTGIGNLRLSRQLFNVIGTTASNAISTLRGGTGGRVSAHYTFISRFIDSILRNTEPPTTPEDARATLNTLELICGQIET